MNLLIPYVHLYNHPDPAFNEYTYGYSDTKARVEKLKKLEKGDYIFFHTSIRGKKYITSYYVVDRILDTSDAIKDRNIKAKYNNPHLLEKPRILDAIVFGDPITSRNLDRPLLFDKQLAKKLSLNIKFTKDKTEKDCINYATRAWRKLEDKDVNMLLKRIEKEKPQETILSTDEVTEIIEKDLENFFEHNPDLIGKSIKIKYRQLDTEVGRIDLLCEDKRGKLIVVELKLGRIGHDAIQQLKRYMNHIKKQSKKEVDGVIICKGIMPAFEEDIKKIKKIKVLFYGWQLKIYQ